MEHCKPLFIKNEVMTLPPLFIYHSVLEIHKNRNIHETSSQQHYYDASSAPIYSEHIDYVEQL